MLLGVNVKNASVLTTKKLDLKIAMASNCQT